MLADSLETKRFPLSDAEINNEPAEGKNKGVPLQNELAYVYKCIIEIAIGDNAQ